MFTVMDVEFNWISVIAPANVMVKVTAHTRKYINVTNAWTCQWITDESVGNKEHFVKIVKWLQCKN